MRGSDPTRKIVSSGYNQLCYPGNALELSSNIIICLASLARAVASLSRTGNTCKYFGTLKSGSPEIQYLGSLVNRKFGNSKHRKIGGSEKRKFR